jgi:hypothetical protein
VWAGEALHAFEGGFVELELEVEGFGDGLVGDVIVAVMGNGGVSVCMVIMLIALGNCI